jgi:hypothetical protein
MSEAKKKSQMTCGRLLEAEGTDKALYRRLFFFDLYVFLTNHLSIQL